MQALYKLHEGRAKATETQLLSIKNAAKLFNFPQDKLYRLVNERKVPYIEFENLSGSKRPKINTKTFADWLDMLARENKTI